MLYKIANAVSNFCVIYLCDIDQVPDFNQMYGKYYSAKSFLESYCRPQTNRTA